MTEYRKGQRVRVSIEGEIGVVHPGMSNGGNLSTRDSYVIRPDSNLPGGGTFWTYAEHLTLLDPAGWPPQVGDIWEANGIEWYIRTSRSVTSALTAVADDGPDYVVDMGKLKARNPVLVRRRDQ